MKDGSSMLRTWRGLLLLGCACAGAMAAVTPAAGSPAAAEQLRASLKLEPSGTLGIDERALLTLEIEGLAKDGRGEMVRPSPNFQIENFRVVAGPARTTRVARVDGRQVERLVLTWSLEPRGLGKARVYDGKVRIENRVLTVPDVEVEVLNRVPDRQPRSRRRDPLDEAFFRRPGALAERVDQNDPRGAPERRQVRLFLRAEAEPNDPWVGQQVLYTLYLYTEVDLRSARPEELPEFQGFWAHEIPQPARLTPEIVVHEGRRIYRFVLLQRALFPRRGGTFEIPPVTATMEALLQDTLGSLLTRPRQVTRSSNPVPVTVRDLPASPAGFQGAIGEMALAAHLSPETLGAGEAATLTVTLSGRGHLQGIPAPSLPEIPGVDVFPPQQQGDETLRGHRVASHRTWSYVLVPQRTGDWRLPAIELPYFDPDRGAYVTARTGELRLTVRRASSTGEEGSTAASGDGASELHTIRTASLPRVESADERWRGASPWLFGLPLLGAALLLGWRRLGRGRTSGPRTSYRRLLEGLGHVPGDERSRQAAAHLEEAWSVYLEDRWQIPGNTPASQWGPLLADRGVPTDTADALARLAEDLHYLRYAPQLSSTSELRQDLIDRSEKLAGMLR